MASILDNTKNRIRSSTMAAMMVMKISSVVTTMSIGANTPPSKPAINNPTLLLTPSM